ncbi:MAG: hypothetical protein AAFV53_37320 [Myxococcota bacterium]
MRGVLRMVLIGFGGWALACGGLDTGTMPSSSPQAVAAANALGLPAVAPGSGAAGPFDGPEGTIYYINPAGQITFVAPQTLITVTGRSTVSLKGREVLRSP